MSSIKKIATCVALFLSFAAALISSSFADDKIHPNDAARFIAGLEPAESSPLAKYTKSKTWQAHASYFNKAWEKVEAARLNEAKSWAGQNVSGSSSTMFYMFSGPDFLYANTFYPGAETYILTGLEPVGQIPGIKQISNPSNLANLRQSMNTILNLSFFITQHMQTQLNTGFQGTVPIILTFMVRTGHTIKDLQYVELDGSGGVVPHSKGRQNGVKITFSAPGGKDKTAYYFRTDLSNGGFKKSGLKEFCVKLGKGNSLVKSASYLMHDNSFSLVRDFLLEHSTILVQDDSGIPLRYFGEKGWDIRPYGRYPGPIPIFSYRYQRDMAKLYKTAKPEAVKFGIGYRWRPNETTILLGRKK